MLQVKNLLPLILSFSTFALTDEGQDLDLSTKALFNPHCSHRVFIDELKSSFEATHISEQQLGISVRVNMNRYTDSDEVMEQTIDLIIPAENKASAATSIAVPDIEVLESRRNAPAAERQDFPTSAPGEYRLPLSGASYIYKHSCRAQE